MRHAGQLTGGFVEVLACLQLVMRRGVPAASK